MKVQEKKCVEAAKIPEVTLWQSEIQQHSLLFLDAVLSCSLHLAFPYLPSFPSTICQPDQPSNETQGGGKGGRAGGEGDAKSNEVSSTYLQRLNEGWRGCSGLSVSHTFSLPHSLCHTLVWTRPILSSASVTSQCRRSTIVAFWENITSLLSPTFTVSQSGWFYTSFAFLLCQE